MCLVLWVNVLNSNSMSGVIVCAKLIHIHVQAGDFNLLGLLAGISLVQGGNGYPYFLLLQCTNTLLVLIYSALTVPPMKCQMFNLEIHYRMWV